MEIGGDTTVPVIWISGKLGMVKALKEAGGEPKYTELAGVGHSIPSSF